MLVAFAFKGGANGISATASGAGTYADPLCGAIALPVVVDAVLYTAGDAVNMLGDALIVFSVFHDGHSFPFRKIFCDGNSIPERRRFYVLVCHCGSSSCPYHE